jgi:hypothetical protein
MKQLFVFALLLSLFIQHSYAQETQSPKIRFVVGLSLPEGIHAGVTYRLASWSQLGVNAGLTPVWEDVFASVSLEHRIYFGNTHPRLGQKTWFCRQGTSYLPREDAGQQFTLNLSVGKDLVFKNLNGLSIDAGVTYWQRDAPSNFAPILRFQFFIAPKRKGKI